MDNSQLIGKALALTMGLAIAACSQLPGTQPPENAQRILAQLCSRPDLMQNVLTTPDLQRAWQAICSNGSKVPAVPVASVQE